jgi:hypothetical protein
MTRQDPNVAALSHQVTGERLADEPGTDDQHA